MVDITDSFWLSGMGGLDSATLRSIYILKIDEATPRAS